MANRSFAELKQDVKNKTGNQQAADGPLGVAVNRGYQRLVTKMINLSGGEYYLDRTTLSINAGDRFIDLPANYLKHFVIFNPNGLQIPELDARGDEFLQREALLSTGVTSQALKFTVVGYNTTTKAQRIYLTPAAPATETWTLFYYFMPDKLVADGDTPLIPEIFEEVLTLFAIADIYENQQNRAMASYYLNRGAGQLGELISDIKTRNRRRNLSITRSTTPRNAYNAASPW